MHTVSCCWMLLLNMHFMAPVSGKENVSKRYRNGDIIMTTESKMSKELIDQPTHHVYQRSPWCGHDDHVSSTTQQAAKQHCYWKWTWINKICQYGKMAHKYLPWTISHRQDCGTCTARLLSVLTLSVDTCIITCQNAPDHYISWDLSKSLKGAVTCLHKLENSAKH